jgi:hypothetical protein
MNPSISDSRRAQAYARLDRSKKWDPSDPKDGLVEDFITWLTDPSLPDDLLIKAALRQLDIGREEGLVVAWNRSLTTLVMVYGALGDEKNLEKYRAVLYTLTLAMYGPEAAEEVNRIYGLESMKPASLWDTRKQFKIKQ